LPPAQALATVQLPFTSAGRRHAALLGGLLIHSAAEIDGGFDPVILATMLAHSADFETIRSLSTPNA
jgi:hypothetical protein